MSSTSIERTGPVLASDLPAARTTPSVLQRVTSAVRGRLSEQRFETALRHASHSEAGDLLAAARRG